MKCLLLNIEMPIGEVCPSSYNDEGLLCYKDCGLADNPELINEKVKNWEKFKAEKCLNVKNNEKK